MTIAIDAREINRGGGGKSRYIRELVRALGKIDITNEYYLYVNQRPDIKLPKNFILVEIPKVKWINFAWVIKDLIKKKPDVFLAATRLYAAAVSPIKTVLVIFDLVIYNIKICRPSFRSVLIERPFFQLATRRAKKIISISESTTRGILDHSQIDKRKISTILIAPYGNSEKALPWEKVKRKYKLPSKYILFLGMLEPRKNVDGLIRAYKLLPAEIKRKYPLVLAGRMGWREKEITEAIGKTKNIIITGYVEDEELPAIYDHAAIFVYPSWYEGFGIPVIEAFSHGVPTITSNGSSLVEIAKGAALLVEPGKRADLAAAMARLILDKKLQANLIERGFRRAKKFSWEKTARATLKVLKEAADA